MLIADGGGGYGGTDWFGYDVKKMWEAIADQDTEPHYEVVQGWRRTSELTNEHLSRVRLYRDNLADAWPPEKSPASAAYIARLDELIEHLTETHAAAAANYTTFSSVALDLSVARTKIEPLYKEYMANQASIAKWQADRDAAAAAPKPSSSPTPSPSPSPQASPVPTAPPVSAEHQEQLNNQARSIMYALSNTVISAQAQLQKPKLYDFGTMANRQGDDHGDGNGSGQSVPPLIPVPAPPAVPPPDHLVQRPHMATTSPVASGHPGVSAINPGSVINPVGGPTLSGTQLVAAPPVSPPVTPGLTIGATNTIPPGTPGLPGILPPAVNSPLGLVPPGASTASIPGGAAIPGGPPRPSLGAQAGRFPTMPSGGVIGSTPGSGVIGQLPGTGSGQTRVGGGSSRVNPIGGVINPQSSAGARSVSGVGAAARLGSGGQLGAAYGQSRRSRSDHPENANTAPWDPDNPWATDEGVDPVVLPQEDPGPINPGPAIGIKG
ncbi:hypothetical protein EV385_2013 [Krasilnikovia cinnamomea]|uniref:PPE family protein n=1 Tax=Krasilnikovia cinnamomea TaxID=349313 RepID=A0A4Q7ZHH5_9ACTN|nr:hypothetical protein [Krasilnikovia cinnamomea]RZU50247.1 hypothetical protein EV385_2013 [Krasilnikovia cinnamomea]